MIEMKDIPGYEGCYAATTDGQIWSHYNNKFLKQSVNWGGYHRVRLSKDGVVKNKRVNRLIALTFIPNPDNLPQVGHDNDIKSDNSVSNLYWTTDLENKYHNGHNKICMKQVRCVETGEVFESVNAASDFAGICASRVSAVLDKPNLRAGGYHWVRV